MPLIAKPDRCPACHITMAFGSIEYRRSRPSLKAAFAAATIVLAAMVVLCFGVLFWHDAVARWQEAFRWRRREAGLIFLFGAIVAVAVVGFLVAKSIRALPDWPRVLRVACPDCQSVHAYLLRHEVDGLRNPVVLGESCSEPPRVESPPEEISDISTAGPEIPPDPVYSLSVLPTDSVQLERRKYAMRRVQNARRASARYDPNLDFGKPPDGDEAT